MLKIFVYLNLCKSFTIFHLISSLCAYLKKQKQKKLHYENSVDPDPEF